MAGEFAAGFASGRSVRQNRRDRKAMQAEQKQKHAQQQARALATSIDNSDKKTQDGIKALTDVAVKLASSGVEREDEQYQKVINSIQGMAMSHANILREIQVGAEAEGVPPELIAQNLQDPVAYVENAMLQANAAIDAAFAARPKFEESSAVRDVDGMGEQLVITRTDPATGRQDFFIERDGERVEVDASQVRGATARTEDVTIEPGTKKTLETSVVNSGEGLSRLFQVQQSFKPEFLTIQGKVKGGLSELKEKAGLELNAEEQQFLQEFSTFQQNAFDNLNRYIKEITGAQMSEAEAERLTKGIPNPDKDGPTRFQAKLQTSVRQLALARARAIHAINNGITDNPWDTFTLDQIETVIEDRHKELVDSGFSQQQADRQVQREFGL